jgi:hypothetical protein
MNELCFCGIYNIDPDTAAYNKDGFPMCGSPTCQAVAQHRDMIRVPLASLDEQNLAAG